jgi:hypothetical protein
VRSGSVSQDLSSACYEIGGTPVQGRTDSGGWKTRETSMFHRKVALHASAGVLTDVESLSQGRACSCSKALSQTHLDENPVCIVLLVPKYKPTV